MKRVSENHSDRVAYTLLFLLALFWIADLLFAWDWVSTVLFVVTVTLSVWLLIDISIGDRSNSGKRVCALLLLFLLGRMADRFASIPSWVSVVLFTMFVVLAIWHLGNIALSWRGGRPA